MTELENQSEEFDWGGDGSDLYKTIAKHVQAALVATDAPYPPPLDQLLTLGNPQEHDDTDDRLSEIGFTQAHVPDLVRMTRDRALNTAMSDSPEVWAPVHALHALEFLDVREHVADLIPLFDVDSEWFGEELPDVLKNAGQSALQPLRDYVADPSRWIVGRGYAMSAISGIAKAHPELRDQAIEILSDLLSRAHENEPYINADVIGDLTDLGAVEALSLIRRAFEHDLVDETIVGDWSEVQEALGLVPDPHDPLVRRSRRRWDARKAEMRAMLPPAWQTPVEVPPISSPRTPNKANKAKNKRKMSAASRKVNKKKRR